MARNIRVASVSFGGTGRAGTIRETIEKNLQEMCRLFEKAAMDNPDIVCFPECSPMLGLSFKEMIEVAEETSEKASQKMTVLAKEYGTYVACPMIDKRNGQFYNSAVLIDRNGSKLGSYHKIHPTIGEIEAGITPGTKPKTFKLDIGTIGFAICFDLNFDDVIKGLKTNGAELVFFPSMYPGGLQLKIWALNYGVYMASAFTGEGSMIIDPLGRVLAVSDHYSRVICKTINLDYGIFHIDYNHEKWDSVKRKYGSKVELEVSRPEAVFMMSSNLPDISVRELIQEFHLEPIEEYFKRASEIRKKALTANRKPS